MRSKVQLGAVAGRTLFVFLFVGTLFIWSTDPREQCIRVEEPVYTKPIYLTRFNNLGQESKRTITLQDTLKQERDKLSEELNKLKMKLGRMDCEVGLRSFCLRI